MRNPARVESVHRALVLLKLMAEQGTIGVTQAAQALDVNASTAQRLLATLALDGFAEQDDARRYRPGPALSHAGFVQTIPELRRLLRPYLERLYERIGETVHIATLVGTRIQHLDGIESTHALRFGLRVGVWLPAHLTAGGKALLADVRDDEIEARYRMAATGIQRLEYSIDMAAFLTEINQVRRTRIATNFEASEPGVAAYAISTGEINGERAALSVALPIARFDPQLAEQHFSALREIVDEVRRDLR